MTKTYQSFLRQSNAQGREKADGYDRSHFDGLDDTEREAAFIRLTEEAKYDHTCFVWLFYLDRNRARATCLALLQNGELSDELCPVEAYRCLFVHFGDPAHQTAMIESSRLVRSAYDKPTAIVIALRAGNSPEVRNYLKEVVLGESDAETVHTAAFEFLCLYEIPRDSDANRAIFNHFEEVLRFGSTSEKQRVLVQVEGGFAPRKRAPQIDAATQKP